jgi:phospholipid/cholesterol/gamma-HCH transport system ATP-binding protein
MIKDATKIENIADNNVVVIKDLFKTFGSNNAILKGINLHVRKGENLVVLGKSGTGKSVLIKCLVGLVVPEKGEMKIFGTEILNIEEEKLNEIRLKIGFLFQNSALYDSMTVGENLGFSLRRHFKDLSENEITESIEATLKSVGLENSIDKMPSELSGGMRKRAGLARTLILKPDLILYDEPTTGLDTITSREMSELILSIQKQQKSSSIIITHDMPCAKLTADRIIILKEGKVYVEGTYEQLENSKDEWVRSFFV